jgi:hypothetical protein
MFVASSAEATALEIITIDYTTFPYELEITASFSLPTAVLSVHDRPDPPH